MAAARAEDGTSSPTAFVKHARWARGVRSTPGGPDDIGRIIAANLVAPLLLTRMVLPGMVRRRSGHIVNHGSLAGKIAIPFEAVYAASKGGLQHWSAAIRQELAGTGVGVTCIVPSCIAGVGQAADHRVAIPRGSGPVSPERVVAAVIEGVRTDSPEIIVRSTPTRPLLALGELMPGFSARVMRSMGIVRLHRGLADRVERSC